MPRLYDTFGATDVVFRNRVEINVRDYAGADPTGATDSYDAIQNAIVDAEAAAASGRGVVVKFYGGKWLLDKTSAGGLKFTRDNAATRGKVTVDGGGATLTLSSNVPRAFDFTKVADYDTFRNIEVRDLVIDAASVGGQHHVVLGTYQSGTGQTRLNFDRITLRVRTINVLNDSNTGTNHRLNVWLASSHPASDEATQTTITNCLFEDCDFAGGNMGIFVGGVANVGSSANVFYDQIVIQRCRWDSGTTASAFYPSAAFFIGSEARGGHCAIIDCYGANSGDVGVEIDSATTAIVRGTTIQDCITSHFYCEVYHALDNTEFQKVEFRDCHARIVSLNPHATTYAATGFAMPGSSSNVGNVTLDGCTYLNKSTNSCAGAMAIRSLAGLKRLTIRDFRLVHDTISYANSSGGSRNPTYIDLRHTSDNTTIIDGLSYRIGGAFTGTDAASTTLKVIRLGPNSAGATHTVSVTNVREDVSVTGLPSNGFYSITVGETSGITRGLIDQFVSSAWSGPDSRAIVIYAAAVANIDPNLRIERCDFTKRSGSNSDVYFVNSTQPKVFIERCKHRADTQLDVASAATLTIPNRPYMVVTGTTGVTAITALLKGSVVTLDFTGACTVTDNGGTLNLAGNFTGPGLLILASDGTNMREAGRAVV